MKAHCFLCHGEEQEKGGELDLRLVRLMRKGGESGPVIHEKEPAESLLLERILSDEMPPGPKKLSIVEKDLIRQWLQSGRKHCDRNPRIRNSSIHRRGIEPLVFSAHSPARNDFIDRRSGVGERRWPRILFGSQNIDHWIVRKATENGFSAAPRANKQTLLRRLSFNLTGLPPTREELRAFLEDESEDAYSKVVERLLASPQYGVRWGRYWLDIAGYAESDGQILGDKARPHAWRYRDYVVDALNRDIPYSQFVREQIAGDQMIEGDIDPNNDEHARLLAATGFLQMAPDLSETENTVLNRNQAVSDTIQTVTSAVLGLTVACAQCHDHRYDPISIDDYYKLRAVFDPAMPLHQWKPPSQRLIDLTNDATKAERAKIEADAVALQDDINARRRAHCQTIQDREINAAPEEVRESLRKAIQTPVKDQTADQKALLESYPKVRTIDWIVGQLVEYDGPAHRGFQEEEKKVQEIRDSKPLARMIMSVQDKDPSSEKYGLLSWESRVPAA